MKRIIAAAVGNCVHIAGPIKFLRLAADEGCSTEFLGAAVPIKDLIRAVLARKPDIVGISYRLTPSSARAVFEELCTAVKEYELSHIRWLFGGTEPVCRIAREYDIFEEIFDGTRGDEFTIDYLRGRKRNIEQGSYKDNLIDRIHSAYPNPLIRHHFGLPSLADTINGIKQLSESRVLDIISIAPDQNAQEHFFDMERADRFLDGAGGVPVRTRDDFLRIYEASRTGNHPLLRCYSGTNNVFDFAKVLVDTIKNAWSAVPLCWYNVLDGRGPRLVEQSIAENQQLMKWHGDLGIPVEVNESHHWSLRDAHDTVGVVSAFLAAYNAKAMGVRDYIAQYMFNVPPDISPRMDLAKMLAKIELIESLVDDNFRVYRQVRTGLQSLPPDLYQAKGQLASSIYLGMAVKPHIVHVVGYCEAHHAAEPEDIIESCRLSQGVIKNCMQGMPDMAADREVQQRKEQLLMEAEYTLKALYSISQGIKDPLSDPKVLTMAIKSGILDAPQLKGNRHACGMLETRVIDGACYAYDTESGKVLCEKDRIGRILSSNLKDICA